MDSDTEIIQGALSFYISMAAEAVITITLSFVIMMFLSWKITLVAMCGMVPIFIFTKVMVGYYMKITK